MSMAVLTPSYGPDVELFGDLHRSVLTHLPATTVHHVVVPAHDAHLFSSHAGPRCRIRTYDEFLPRRYVRLPCPPLWVDATRPWPPVRGWILQQAMKLAASAAMHEDTVLLADSDVVFVRPTTEQSFSTPDGALFFRADNAVHDAMPRHIRWHGVARNLLGLPGAPLPLHDYVSPLNIWQPSVVRALLSRIETVVRKSWLTTVCSQLHFSEFILYGVFVDELLRDQAHVYCSTTAHCHTYWETEPLDGTAARKFARATGVDDVAIMISAKSRTSHAARAAAAAEFDAGVA